MVRARGDCVNAFTSAYYPLNLSRRQQGHAAVSFVTAVPYAAPVTRTRPLTLTVAAVLAALEGGVSVIYGVAFLVGFSASKATLDVTGFLFFALLGAGLVLCSLGLSQLRSWGRGPVAFVQIMLILLAWNFHGVPAIAVPMALLGLAVLVCLFLPASLAALSPEE